jgi:hypothetical protein
LIASMQTWRHSMHRWMHSLISLVLVDEVAPESAVTYVTLTSSATVLEVNSISFNM